MKVPIERRRIHPICSRCACCSCPYCAERPRKIGHHELTVGHADPSEPLEYADSQDVTPEELTGFLKSVAELTTALNAFVMLAEELFPHPDNGLPLMRRLRAWRRARPDASGEIHHEIGGEIPPKTEGLSTDRRAPLGRDSIAEPRIPTP